MLVTILLITLAFSLCLQIFVIIQYLDGKRMTYYRIFLGTFIINTILMVIISVYALRDPASIYRVDLKFVMWLLSGFITFIILFVKINTILKIFKRSKDPANYTINFFGKKVYEQGILKKHEFAMFALLMPIFLFAGSYFFARLINMILYGRT
jgi:hypothetical protein